MTDFDKILDKIDQGQAMTASDVANLLGISTQRATAILTSLVRSGRIYSVIIKGHVYYVSSP